MYCGAVELYFRETIVNLRMYVCRTNNQICTYVDYAALYLHGWLNIKHTNESNEIFLIYGSSMSSSCDKKLRIANRGGPLFPDTQFPDILRIPNF